METAPRTPRGPGILGRVGVVEVLVAHGGVASRAALEAVVGRAALGRAVAGGEVVRLARGRYAVAEIDEASRVAHALSGVVARRSAALAHGWAVASVPPRPEVTLPRGRRPDRRAGAADVRFADLGPDDVVRVGGPGGAAGLRVTSPDRTLVDCLRQLSLPEALAVADSALRAGVTPGRLARLAAGTVGPGSSQARRVARLADARAANPFESVLRALAADVAGLRAVPQVELWEGATFLGRPDLVDRDLGLVLEADSFAWHGSRSALDHDCRRYDELVAAGWVVLRFSYEQVLGEQAWVTRILRLTTDRLSVPDGPHGRTALTCDDATAARPRRGH